MYSSIARRASIYARDQKTYDNNKAYYIWSLAWESELSITRFPWPGNGCEILNPQRMASLSKATRPGADNLLLVLWSSFSVK